MLSAKCGHSLLMLIVPMIGASAHEAKAPSNQDAVNQHSDRSDSGLYVNGCNTGAADLKSGLLVDSCGLLGCKYGDFEFGHTISFPASVSMMLTDGPEVLHGLVSLNGLFT